MERSFLPPGVCRAPRGRGRACGAYVVPTASPSETLRLVRGLLEAVGPILAGRVVAPCAPAWMDDATAAHLLSLSDAELERLERNPYDVAASLSLGAGAGAGGAFPALTRLHHLSRPLFHPSVFPLYTTTNNNNSDSDSDSGRHVGKECGRSRRRSKSRPRAAKRAQIRAVSSLLADALGRCGRRVTRVLDVGAGHGHLSGHLARALGGAVGVVGIERDEALVRVAGELLERKGLQTGTGTRTGLGTMCSSSPSPGSVWMVEADAGAHDCMAVVCPGPADALVGLHACGSLGDAVLRTAVARDAAAVVLVSCCLQKRAEGRREALSRAARDDAVLRAALSVRRAELGATNSPRGYARRGDLVARQTRHATRTLLARAGRPVRRVGDEAHGISRHVLRAGLHATLPEIERVHGVCVGKLTETETETETEMERLGKDGKARSVVELWEQRARDEYQVMRKLTLPRAFAAAALEMAVVLDRAAFLEDAGYTVTTCKGWADEISARNLTIVAWKE